MLIVEGADLVGKTHLCKKFLMALAPEGYRYAHFSRLPRDFDYMSDYCAAACRRIVQDRFHMSEPVYAEVRGDESFLTDENYRLVDAWLRGYGATTVVITAHDSLLAKRYAERDREEMYGLDKICHANQLYLDITESHDLRDWDFHFHCNKEKPWVTEDQLMLVLEAYSARQSRQSRLGATRNGNMMRSTAW
jgi:hypothetical protein